MVNGIDICHLRGRQFSGSDMVEFDRIYFMDEDNYQEAKFMSGELWQEHKAELLLNELYPGKNKSVPDPYYGGEDGYHDVFEMISRACDVIIEKYGNQKNQD
jgi:protein-tyrosine phosphatase